MDDIDRANDINEQLREIALAEHFRRMDAHPSRDLAREGCADCGLPIPVCRLEAMPGAIRCRPCQIESEVGQQQPRNRA